MSTTAVTSSQHELTSAHVAPVAPINWRLPIIYGLAVITSLYFMLTAKGVATLDLNPKERDHAIFDVMTLSVFTVCTIVFVLCLLVFSYSVYRAFQRKPVGVLLACLVGVTLLFALLVWYGADSAANITLTVTLAGGVVYATPIVFGAMAGVVSERVGIVNIAIEGQLLAGAFTGILVASASGNAWVGVICAPIAGALVGALLGAITVKYNIDQIITGVVLNVLVLGLTSFFFSTVMAKNESLNSGSNYLHNIRIPLLADIPVIGPVIFNQTAVVYIMYVAVIALTFMLFRSRWGLRLRACGEHPRAAATVGINVRATRIRNSLLSGAIAGLGGAYLTIGVDPGLQFGEEMSAGKGYIALAAMILGKWHPIGAMGAALLFGLADSMATLMKTMDAAAPISGYFTMTPYIITIFAVAGFVGKSRAPAAENKPYVD